MEDLTIVKVLRDKLIEIQQDEDVVTCHVPRDMFVRMAEIFIAIKGEGVK